MNILNMHIRLDEHLNNVSSNLRQVILPEHKDDFLNMTISEFVRQRVFNPPSEKSDGHIVNNSYSGIQTLIRNFSFTAPATFPHYADTVSVDFNTIATSAGGVGYISKPTNALPFTMGRMYNVVTLYSADNLSAYGSSDPTVQGETFTAIGATWITPSTFASTSILRYSGNQYHTGASGALSMGRFYTVQQGSITFTAAQIVSPGITVWNSTYNGLAVIYNSNIATDLVLSAGDSFMINGAYDTTPLTGWTAGSILKEVSTTDEYLHYISARATTNYTCNNVNSSKIVPVRLVSIDEFESFLYYGHGSAKSSPLGVIINNNLIVSHTANNTSISSGNRFSISNVDLTYYKKPNEVSLAGNVDCDLEPSVHEFIVRTTAESLAASIKAGNFELLKANKQESILNKSQIQV